MIDELGRLKQVTEWQQELLNSLSTVLSRDTYNGPERTLRKQRFQIEDYILENSREKLREQEAMLSSSLNQCRDLIATAKELAEIMNEENSRAIFIFTMVTVIFLPLSFIASYLSMNGGPSEKTWGKTQALFWQISAPLAVTIGVFCLVVAWHGSKIAIGRERVTDFLGIRGGRAAKQEDESGDADIDSGEPGRTTEEV